MEPLPNPETTTPFCLQMQRLHCINKFKMLHSVYKCDDYNLFTNKATPFCLHMQRTNLLLASPTNKLLPPPNSLQLPPIQQQHETFTLQHREQFDDVWLVPKAQIPPTTCKICIISHPYTNRRVPKRQQGPMQRIDIFPH